MDQPNLGLEQEPDGRSRSAQSIARTLGHMEQGRRHLAPRRTHFEPSHRPTVQRRFHLVQLYRHMERLRHPMEQRRGHMVRPGCLI